MPPPRPETVNEQLDRWVWFNDGTTFIYLIKRVDKDGVICDKYEWNVINIARDSSVSKVPMLARIQDANYILEHQPSMAICHIVRENNSVRIIRSIESYENRDLPYWIDAPIGNDYPKRLYTITNPLMETLDWKNKTVRTTLRRIPQPNAYGFGAGFQLWNNGKWQWIDDIVDMTFDGWRWNDANRTDVQPEEGKETIDGWRWNSTPKNIEFIDCTLYYEDKLLVRNANFPVRNRVYSLELDSEDIPK